MTTKKTAPLLIADSTYLIATCTKDGRVIRVEVPKQIVLDGDPRTFTSNDKSVGIDGVFGLLGGTKVMKKHVVRLSLSKTAIATICNHLLRTDWKIDAIHETIVKTLLKHEPLTALDFVKKSKDSIPMPKASPIEKSRL